MKKVTNVAISLVCLFMVGSAIAGLSVINRGSFSGTGTGAAAIEVVIPAQNGIIRNMATMMNCDTSATVTVYRPHIETEAYALSTSTTVQVHTASSNTVNGFSPTTSDYLLVRNGTSGYQLRKISSIGAWDSSNKATTYVLASSVTMAVDDPVYVADVTLNVSIPALAGVDQTDLRYTFTGYRKMPVLISVPASAGDAVISGTYDVEQ